LFTPETILQLNVASIIESIQSIVAIVSKQLNNHETLHVNTV
jgi:hypothetical protein